MIRLYLNAYKPTDLSDLYNVLTVAAGMCAPTSRAKYDIEEALVYLTGYSDAKFDAVGRKALHK